jgi:hypothetical protein
LEDEKEEIGEGMGRLRERRNWIEDRKRKRKERDRMKREERIGNKK